MARLTSLLLLGAIGVSAHPSAHARFHNKQRNVQERDIGDIITAVIDGVEVFWTQTEDYGASATSASAAIVADKPNENVAVSATASATTLSTAVASTSVAASTSTSSAAATSTSSSSSSSASGVTEFTSFDDYCSSSSKRATTAEILYSGNTGSTYGCNIMLLGDSSLASEYNNTVKFFGGSSDMYCVLWNKMGADGGVDGFFVGDTAAAFSIAAGDVQYVALDANSQGGGACVEGTVDDLITTTYGEIGMTWVEWDAQNDSNDGWSGADASCIVAQTAGLTVNGLEVCLEDDSSECSSISADATTVNNAYTAALTDADGIGLNIDGGLKITVNIGY